MGANESSISIFLFLPPSLSFSKIYQSIYLSMSLPVSVYLSLSPPPPPPLSVSPSISLTNLTVLTFCCCRWCRIWCSQTFMFWEALSMIWTPLESVCWSSSRLGLITTLGISRTTSTRNNGGLASSRESSPIAYRLAWRRRLMASRDSRVPGKRKGKREQGKHFE